MFKLRLNVDEDQKHCITLPTMALAIELGRSWCMKRKASWFHVGRQRCTPSQHHPVVGDAFKVDILASTSRGWKRVP